MLVKLWNNRRHVGCSYLNEDIIWEKWFNRDKVKEQRKTIKINGITDVEKLIGKSKRGHSRAKNILMVNNCKEKKKLKKDLFVRKVSDQK